MDDHRPTSLEHPWFLVCALYSAGVHRTLNTLPLVHEPLSDKPLSL
jgi:hypothetical protein